jgi:hypothetical protein
MKMKQVVRYCGYYSNKARGQRRLQQQGLPASLPLLFPRLSLNRTTSAATANAPGLD